MARAVFGFIVRLMCVGRGLSPIQRRAVRRASFEAFDAGEVPIIVLGITRAAIRFIVRCNVIAESAMFTKLEAIGVTPEGNHQRRAAYRHRASLQRFRA